MSNGPTLESNGGGPSPNEPLISSQNFKLQLEDDMAKTLEDKEDIAVYKSTVDKVDIKQATKYVGLSKEELERYVHDPYWRKLRYFCLGLFWLAWIAMFAAAIIIVLVSPKCPPKPQLKWWEKKTCYQIWTKSYKDSNGDGIGDLNGIFEQLKYINAFKASALWLSPLLKSTSGSGYDVVNHSLIDPVIGTESDFDDLVEGAHQKDMYIIMDLPLTTVSVQHDWFTKSLANEPGFKNYFHWRKDQVDPKTWSSVDGHDGFYHHWGVNKKYALLNWDHEPVRRAMEKIAEFWISRKVDGFYLGEIQYMSVLETGQPNWNKIHTYLQEFNAHIRNFTAAEKREITTFTSHGFNEPKSGITVDEFKLAMRVNGDLDYVINNELVNINESCRADCLQQHLSGVINFHNANNISWPMWEIGHPYVSRVSTRMGSRARGEMITLLLLALPGSINIYYGDEIGMIDGIEGEKRNFPRTPMQWSSNANAGFTTGEPKVLINDDYTTVNYKAQSHVRRSTLRMLKRMTTIRTEDAFLYGNLTVASVNVTENLLMLNTSTNYTTTHYVTLLNFGPEQTFDLTKSPYNLQNIGWESSFITGTTNVFQRNAYSERQVVDLTKFALMTDEAVVIRLKAVK